MPSWNNPYGSLPNDQRHRIRAFGSWDIPGLPPKFGAFNLGAIWYYDTGTPYTPGFDGSTGIAGTVSSRNYVTNPGYALPPSSVVLLLHGAGRVPDRYDQADRPLAHVHDPGRQHRRYLHSAAGLERLQQPGEGQRRHDVRTALSPGTGNTFLGFNPFTTIPVKRPDQRHHEQDLELGLRPEVRQLRELRLVPAAASLLHRMRDPLLGFQLLSVRWEPGLSPRLLFFRRAGLPFAG